MKYLFLLLAASFCHAKVYDCFIFFNEFEILEMRLNEMNDKVDKFVLVESVETFRGTPKPLYFNENKERFSKFLDKIIHVVIEEPLDTSASGDHDAWDREFYQRDQIVRGLKNCSDDDLILLSDVDEIVRPEKIDEMVALNRDRGIQLFGFYQDHYRFYMNVRSQQLWLGTAATTYGILKHKSAQWLRDNRSLGGSMKILTRGGWHFTYLGSEERNIYKLESFAHKEYDSPDLKNHAAIKKALAGKCRVVKIDSSYPMFVQNNLPLIKKWGFIMK